jgi:hypothetical protein
MQISRCSVWARLALRDRERHRLAARRASGKNLMVRVDQLNQHLVLTGRHPGHVDCIEITRVRPQPRQIVDVYVQMPDPRRYVERAP